VHASGKRTFQTFARAASAHAETHRTCSTAILVAQRISRNQPFTRADIAGFQTIPSPQTVSTIETREKAAVGLLAALGGFKKIVY
jgi:hypothetical protein